MDSCTAALVEVKSKPGFSTTQILFLLLFVKGAIITCSCLSSILAVISMSQSLYFQVLILFS